MYVELENKDNVERIKGEIYLSDDISDAFPNKYPHKSEATVTCICIKTFSTSWGKGIGGYP